MADYNRAIELDPMFENAYNNRGVLYATLNRYDEALNDFDRVIKLDDEDKYANYNRGRVDYELKRHKEGLAIEFENDLAYAYLKRWNVYRGLKQYDEELAELSRTLEFGVEDKYTYEKRGTRSGPLILDSGLSVSP